MNSKNNNCVRKDLEIAPGHTVGEWKGLQLGELNSPDWNKAIAIFESRIQHRYIDPVDVLIAHEIGHRRGTFGFAILAIDCIIMETIQGFRDGVVDHNRQSSTLIGKFLVERNQFKSFFCNSGQARYFYRHCRSALLHSGGTGGDIIIHRHGPLLQNLRNGRIVINRTAFHEALKREFQTYLEELGHESDTPIRNKFKKVMVAICGG